MNERSDLARKDILSKVYEASGKIKDDFGVQAIVKPYSSFYNLGEDEVDLMFAKEFNQIGGNFIYCEDEKTCFNKMEQILKREGLERLYCNEYVLKQKLEKYGLEKYMSTDLLHGEVSLTSCEMLVARTGSIVVSSLGLGDRNSSVFAPIHFCVAYNHQVVLDLQDALYFFKKKHQSGESAERPSFMSIITGPSKTADIEKTLVKGVHGPEHVFVFFIDMV